MLNAWLSTCGGVFLPFFAVTTFALAPMAEPSGEEPQRIGGGLVDPSPALDQLATDPLTRAHAASYRAALLIGAGSKVEYPPSTMDAVTKGVTLITQRNSPHKASPAHADVLLAIDEASRVTGVSRAFLRHSAARESSFDSKAVSPTSSARGLYQFVDSTWLSTIRKHGARHGVFPTGRPPPRAELLRLRYRVDISARMAAELAKENRAVLETALGRRASDSDLYVAHFLGAKGAVKLIAAAAKTPWYPASAMFPSAARANPGIFYNRGKPRSTAEVLDDLSGR